ncbi:MAG TPA: gas vesicle protein [Gemmatimonadaceae bacterium]|nr:gas vesicle protein [Gemmatimonadaceae bacterium]
MTDRGERREPLDDELVLGDLLNHVLDKGVVIAGDVTISVADIDLVRVGLSVLLASVETEERMLRGQRDRADSHADVRVLPGEREP